MSLNGKTYVFNSNVTLPSGTIGIENVNGTLFTYNGGSANALAAGSSNILYVASNPTAVYYADSWDSDDYKTITFVSEPTSYDPNENTFMQWFEENATEYVAPTPEPEPIVIPTPSQYYRVGDTELIAVANAIRAKTGGSSNLEFPTDFITAISSL